MTFVEVPTEVWSSSVFPFLSQGLYQLRVRTCAFFSLLSNSPYWDLAMVWWSLALFFSLGYIIHEFEWFLPLPSPGDENHRARKLNNRNWIGRKSRFSCFFALKRGEYQPGGYLTLKSTCFSTSSAAMFFAVFFVYYSEVTKEHDSNIPVNVVFAREFREFLGNEVEYSHTPTQIPWRGVHFHSRLKPNNAMK